MDTATLARAMGDRLSLSTYAEYAPFFNDALRMANCTTVDRAAMFCAQIGHESAGLYYMEEIASGDAYDTRTDLGNTPQVDGDGRLYKGRGPIQLTGKNNYRNFGRWCAEKRLVSDPEFFVQNPTQVSTPKWGFLAATWYWTVSRNMNSFADRADIRGASIAVNGGTTGLDDRIRRWNYCRTLGTALLPTEGDEMSLADDELGKKFPSRSKYRANNDPVDTLAGFVLNIDARIHEMFVEEQALKGVDWCVALIKREAANGDAAAKAVLAKIEGKKA
ncbi:MAG: hypothetical protein DI630_16910 [Gordonia sp. (in: high G+C Gram-positive bacteria)]|nr:MAG: hypothetical protein DI630_16910 [Gordonia sp. (in: high G+C Gram-positive bacteria)]